MDIAFLKALRNAHPDVPILCLGDALLERSNLSDALEIADGAISSPLTFRPELITEWSRSFISTHGAALGLNNFADSKERKRVTLGRPLAPRHELFLHPRYRWPFSRHRRYTSVTTTWGCPYSCSYCTASNLPPLYRPAEEILTELRAIKRLGVREIYFADKSFGIPQENVRKILHGMVAERFDFSWSSYFHPNQFTPEVLEMMKAAGCHTIIIGIETRNLNRLRAMGRVISEEKLDSLLKHADRIGLDVCGDFIIGLPGEKEDDVRGSLAYALSLPLAFASFNIATPLPSTSIRREQIQAGRMSGHDHHFDTTGLSRILPTDHLSSSMLLELRDDAVRRFYLNPAYLLRRIRRIRSLEHFLIQAQEALEIIRKTLFTPRSTGP
jgi:radical SAM superfamily enzyme YgiQ (UPF0313 family)